MAEVTDDWRVELLETALVGELRAFIQRSTPDYCYLLRTN